MDVEPPKVHPLLTGQTTQHAIQHTQRLHLTLLLQGPNGKLRPNLGRRGWGRGGGKDRSGRGCW
jgi:hypothetical protein